MKRYRIITFTAILIFVMISVSFAYIFLSKNNTDPLNFQVQNVQDTGTVSRFQRQALSDNITNSRNNLITETVHKVSSAVVSITVTEIKQYRDPFYSFWGDDPFFRQFFGDRTQEYKSQNRGSGTIISPDGYILTNDHVAGNGVEIMVTMTNGKHYKAKKIGTDPVSDVCLLKIDETNLPYIKFGNSDEIIIGEWVIALGNPFGLFEINNQPIVTVGVISASGMNLEPVNNRYYLNMIQTDAAINGGNSGGPLINSVGELIGMNTLIYGAQGNIGIGFAIPINKINKIIDELGKSGNVDRDFWIGMRVQNIDEQIAKYYNLPSTTGVIVTYVEKGSPTEKAGIEVGDIITNIEKYSIQNDKALVGIFQEFRTGQTITITINREKEILTKKMKLDKRND